MSTEQLALARVSDPPTSHRAAASIGKGVEEAVQWVYEETAIARECGGFTDDELCALLPDLHPPTVKSARSRLTRAGRLRDSGRTRPSNRGRAQVVWVLS